jgi:cysteine desulfurase
VVQVRDEVREAVASALSLYGNPSSVHAEGRASRAAIEAARAKVAALVGAQPEDVIFTSGGTEANALALAAQSGQAWHCYMSAVEHPSVLAGGRFYRETTTAIPVTPDGVIDLEILARELEKHHLGGWRPFVSLMVANNETGAVQPVAETSKIVHEAGGLFHTDAVQAAGRIRLDMAALGAHMLSLSAHKIGGPKGVGALVLGNGASVEPLIKGGGQERRRRAGANVAGMSVWRRGRLAADLVNAGAMAKLRDELGRCLTSRAGCGRAFGGGRAVAQQVASPCRARGRDFGDRAGPREGCREPGAACSSGKVTSHVLSAMGLGGLPKRDPRKPWFCDQA